MNQIKVEAPVHCQIRRGNKPGEGNEVMTSLLEQTHESTARSISKDEGSAIDLEPPATAVTIPYSAAEVEGGGCNDESSACTASKRGFVRLTRGAATTAGEEGDEEDTPVLTPDELRLRRYTTVLETGLKVTKWSLYVKNCAHRDYRTKVRGTQRWQYLLLCVCPRALHMQIFAWSKYHSSYG